MDSQFSPNEPRRMARVDVWRRRLAGVCVLREIDRIRRRDAGATRNLHRAVGWRSCIPKPDVELAFGDGKRNTYLKASSDIYYASHKESEEQNSCANAPGTLCRWSPSFYRF